MLVVSAIKLTLEGRRIIICFSEKKCVAIPLAIKKFINNTPGKESAFQNDQNPLPYLRNRKNCNGRLMRWAFHLELNILKVQEMQGGLIELRPLRVRLASEPWSGKSLRFILGEGYR